MAADPASGDRQRPGPCAPLPAPTCACERPILEREPGDWVGCAKCGRRVGLRPAAGVIDEAVAGGHGGAVDEREEVAGREAPIDWPFALAAGDRDGQTEGRT